MSPSSRPHPILKRESSYAEQSSDPLPFFACTPKLFSPRVHFPPTPRLTSTHPTYSSHAYDRTPIFISPNECELPERCMQDEESCGRKQTSEGRKTKDSYFHPEAYEVCELESMPSPPTLLWDLPPLTHNRSSSEDEDDSDMAVTPPEHSPPPFPSALNRDSNFEDEGEYTSCEMQSDAAFLPVYKVQGTRAVEVTPWVARKPGLKRKALRPLLKRTGDFGSEFGYGGLRYDEGCLGGF